MSDYTETEQNLAKVAYEAYCESTGGVSLIDKPRRKKNA